MALEPLTWEHTCEAIAILYNTDAQTIANTLTANGVEVGNVEQAFRMLEDTAYEIWYNSDGSVRSYNYVGVPESLAGVPQVIDSNIVTAKKTAIKIPLNTTPSTADPTKVTFGAGMKQAGNFVIKEILPAVAAANVGITLGRAIDSALYNANPDYWDSNGWSSINPETWGSITQGDASLGATVFNTVFKIDPVTNTSQTYLDQDVLAYLALVLQGKGFFNDGNQITIDDTTGFELTDVTLPFNYFNGGVTWKADYSTFNWALTSGSCKTAMFAIFRDPNYVDAAAVFASETSFSINNNSANSITRHGKTYYYYVLSSGGREPYIGPDYNVCTATRFPLSINEYRDIAYILLYGTATGGTEGITTQDGATTPQLSSNDTVAETLLKLQTQFSDLFNNAISQDVIQPDGTVKTYTYVPVGQAQPNPNPTDGYEPQNQPISSTSTQAEPEVDPETSTEAQLEYLIGLLTSTPTSNIENTGGGNTPSVVIPTGSASALYSIYNPTNSEVNSFGSWLWSSNFVDQLLKMFNDPMQAIISLHKVFCTPSVSGRDDIKVGYLNSGVQANVVDSQYVTIPCGTVNLLENFQNVFDYPPYTEVSLYLPFIGIVKLDVDDVMRSTITITYHVDVLTGTCLVEVNVVRDMFGGVLYQYAGDCCVHYPLSSGSYMGIVSALVGVAGTIASGGALAPMAIGIAGGAMRAKSSVERSGSFGGNSGAMGCKKPYLIIKRPQVNVAEHKEHFFGLGANEYTLISQCVGHIKCSDVHLKNIPYTQEERDELEMLLMNGIEI